MPFYLINFFNYMILQYMMQLKTPKIFSPKIVKHNSDAIYVICWAQGAYN